MFGQQCSYNLNSLYLYYNSVGLKSWGNGARNKELPDRCLMKRPAKLGTVAQACNPSYSGGRDQEDHSSKPAPDK
jgi:hypothetical protein